MDRAARVMRRSGVKLLSYGGGHADLNVVVSEQREIKNAMKAFMTAQNSGVQYMMKWAMNEENVVIQDVCSMMVEINAMWTEVQTKFIEHAREFRRMFEAILDGERRLDQSKTNLVTCEQRELKLRKELKKAARRATLEDLNHIETRIAQCHRQKEQARQEFEAHKKETETNKHAHFKEGVLRMSEAYAELGHKTSLLFETQATVSINMPDTMEEEGQPNSGYIVAKQSLLQARDKLSQYNRENYMYRADAAQGPAEAPPPYDPGDYFTGAPEDSPQPPAEEPPPSLDAQPPNADEPAPTYDRPTSPIQRTQSLPLKPERPPAMPRQHSLPSRHRPPLPERPPRPHNSPDTGDPAQEAMPSTSNQSQAVPNLNLAQPGTSRDNSDAPNKSPRESGDDPPEYSLAVPGTSNNPPTLASLASHSVPVVSTDSVPDKTTIKMSVVDAKGESGTDESSMKKTDQTILPATEANEEDKPTGAIGGLALFD